MHIRTRKLIGTIACAVFLTVYCLIAMAIGGQFFVDVSWWLQLIYFVIAGMLWLPGVMAIIRWMSLRPSDG